MTGPDDKLVEDVGPWARRRARLARHVYWMREQGLARLVEEDDLHPVQRTRSAIAKRRWRAEHGRPGEARAVFIVGVQRSGTNMMVRGLERTPQVQVHNENDRRVFERFQLRSDRVVENVVASSPHEVVLFKPLCDSHRVDDLLDLPGLGVSPRALWAFRDVDGRARSAVAKFGDVNRRVLVDLVANPDSGRWQAGGLRPEDTELIASFDPGKLSPEAAAALFWYVRNNLLFTRGFADRDDVLVAGYRALVQDPEGQMRRVAAFVGLEADRGWWAHIERRSPRRELLELPPRLRGLCDDLTDRLEANGAQPPVVSTDQS